MKIGTRLYENVIREHLSLYRQMVFLSGPRQVGKTTLARCFATDYLNWETKDVRQLVLKGAKAVGDSLELAQENSAKRILVFDEIHRYSKWKGFLKGFFDLYERQARIFATGSARLDVYKRGGDSMMGRYFPYRIHPLSVAELNDPTIPDEKKVTRTPREITDDQWESLNVFGGFPEPLANGSMRFLRKWRALRLEQLFREDIRDITRSAELDQIEALALILANRSGVQLVMSSLASEVTTSEPTVKKWIALLKALYYGFTVRPYYKNVENSIRKTPKWYLRDWSGIEDAGKRTETFVACHLLKAVEGWSDLGFGDFDLFYIRDKKKREVDFLVTRDKQPWFVAEVKNANEKLSSALSLFQRQTGARHAFQIVAERPFEDVDCFSFREPTVVSARTFLSQLL